LKAEITLIGGTVHSVCALLALSTALTGQNIPSHHPLEDCKGWG